MLTLLISPRVEDLSLSILLVFYFIVIVWYFFLPLGLFELGDLLFQDVFQCLASAPPFGFGLKERRTQGHCGKHKIEVKIFKRLFLSQIRLGFPRPSEIPEKELKSLLMRALQPPIHNQPKMNVGWVVTSFKNTFTILSDVKHCLVNVCRMEPMIQNWIPLKKRWINIGAHDKHRLEYSKMTKSRNIVLIHLCLRYISKNMVPYTFGVG